MARDVRLADHDQRVDELLPFIHCGLTSDYAAGGMCQLHGSEARSSGGTKK